MTDLVIIPLGGVTLAMTREQYASALEEGAKQTQSHPVHVAPAEELLTAEQCEERTSVPASWFAEKARKEEIPVVWFGKYPRFRLSTLTEALGSRPKVLGPTHNLCVVTSQTPVKQGSNARVTRRVTSRAAHSAGAKEGGYGR